MKFIIILVCLGLERFSGVGSLLKRFSWFNQYVELYKPLTHSNLITIGGGSLGILLIALPIPVIVAIIYCLLWSKLNGLISLLIGILVLLYCIGPKDLFQEVKAYQTALSSGDRETANKKIMSLVNGALPTDDKALAHMLTENIFIQANTRIFGVLLWFCIFGPFGALFYRMITLLRFEAEQVNSPFANLAKMTVLFQDVLDWLPVRFFTLGYTVVGNFSKSFAFWIDNVLTGTDANRELLIECPMQALGTSKEESLVAQNPFAENNSALEIIDRVLVVFMVVAAIFTLGAWVY